MSISIVPLKPCSSPVAESGTTCTLSEHLPVLAGIAHNSALTSVAQLSNWSGWSERQRQHLFACHIGVSPNYRLHEALALMQGGHLPVWAELALRLGYFDQAHFIRDFTRMAGQSTRKYVQAQTG